MGSVVVVEPCVVDVLLTESDVDVVWPGLPDEQPAPENTSESINAMETAKTNGQAISRGEVVRNTYPFLCGPADGGVGGIRTLETSYPRLHDFQSCSLSQLGHHSARHQPMGRRDYSLQGPSRNKAAAAETTLSGTILRPRSHP